MVITGSLHVSSCSTDQGGLVALSDGPCTEPSSILVDLVRFFILIVVFFSLFFEGQNSCLVI